MAGNVVQPSKLLAQVQAGTGLQKFADKVLTKIDPPGTPFAKVRTGYVTGYDPATHTCTAKIGDQTVSIPSIPVLAGVVPALNASGQFLQVSNENTTQYTLIGMLLAGQGQSTVRIRKPANESVFNTGANDDDHLRFYGMAGRTYLFDAMLVVFQNTGTATLDIRLGWTLPAGALWTGGGPGPATAIATSLSGTEGPGSANWRAAFSTTGILLPYGVEGSSGVGVDGVSVVVPFKGSIKMGATSGVCNLAWGQNAPGTATTTVREGSFLKADMTSEYTL